MTFQIYFLLTSFNNLFNIILATYIYQEFDNVSLKRDNLIFNVYLQTFKGVLLYGLDSENKLLIKVNREMEFRTIHIIFNSEEIGIKLTKTTLKFCSLNEDVYLDFTLRLSRSELTIKCRNMTWSYKLRQNTFKDEFDLYPQPNHDFKKKKKLFIWMGNIGPYIGRDSAHYKPLQNQLYGCTDKFTINGKGFHLKKRSGNQFIFPCDINYQETEYKGKNVTKRLSTIKMYNCTHYSMNPLYCQTNPLDFSEKTHSYHKQSMSSEIDYFRIEWKNSASKNSINYCLLEMKYKNEMIILLFLDQDGSVSVESKNSNDPNIQINLKIFMPNFKRNLLLIFTTNIDLIIKVFDGQQIQTHIYHINSLLSLINVGFCHVNYLRNFAGKMRFRYNSLDWRPLINENGKSTPNPISKGTTSLNYIYSILFGIGVFILLLCLSNYYCQKENKLNISCDKSPKRTKTPSPNLYEYEVFRIPQNKNPDSRPEAVEDDYSHIDEMAL